MNLSEQLQRLYGAAFHSKDLVKPQYRTTTVHPIAGFCYLISEAVYHLWAKERGYSPATMKVDNDTHWFLISPTGTILDPTSAQFDFPLDYDKAVKRGFLTKEPCKRTRTLVDRAFIEGYNP